MNKRQRKKDGKKLVQVFEHFDKQQGIVRMYDNRHRELGCWPINKITLAQAKEMYPADRGEVGIVWTNIASNQT